MKRLTHIAVMTIFLTGCAVGPDFIRPETKVQPEDRYLNATLLSEEASGQSMNHWWERIEDPALNSYVDQLLDQNLQLKQAAERVIQARARVNSTRGGFFPTLGADGSASRSFTPGQTAGNSLGGSFTPTQSRIYNTSYAAELNTSWQIDLFGRIRRSVEAAEAGYNASLYDQDALTQSLIAELLNRRVSVAVNKQLLDLAQKNLQNRQQFYDLVKRRYDLGASGTSLADVYLAEENFSSVQADVHQFERLLADDLYSFDVLLGQKPGTTDPTQTTFPMIAPPFDAPLCVPASLVDRRPDLRASELRIQAANAEIGVAVADLYPSLNLGGSIGFTGDNNTNNILSADQLAGSILASLTARIFEGGSLRANIRLQESEARELAAGYAESVLNALREVESALKADYELERQLGSALQSVDALRQAEAVSEDRYVKGIQTLQQFLETQQRRYLAEQSYLSLQQVRWNTRIALYLALGGDWLGDETEARTESCATGKDD